jgi:hypothetical protein
MFDDYFASVDSLHTADWHTRQLPAWSVPVSFPVQDQAMMHIIHVDVVRLGRVIAAFPSVSHEGISPAAVSPLKALYLA